MVVARDSQKGTLRPDQLKVSQSVVKRVVNTRREMIVSDTGDEAGGMSQQESVARLELHTIVAIPVDKLAGDRDARRDDFHAAGRVAGRAVYG